LDGGNLPKLGNIKIKIKYKLSFSSYFTSTLSNIHHFPVTSSRTQKDKNDYYFLFELTSNITGKLNMLPLYTVPRHGTPCYSWRNKCFQGVQILRYWYWKNRGTNKIKVQFFEHIITTARSNFTRPWHHLSPPNFKRQFDHRNYLKNVHPTH
jgi:hypothetical protein